MDFTWIVPEKLAVGGATGFTTRSLRDDHNIDVVICVAPLDEVAAAPPPDHRFPVSFRQPDHECIEGGHIHHTFEKNDVPAGRQFMTGFGFGRMAHWHSLAFDRAFGILVKLLAGVGP